MKKIVLMVKASSRPEPYEIEIAQTATSFTLSCSCGAGVFGKSCKHKISVLKGDLKCLVKTTDKEKLLQIQSIANASNFPFLWARYEGKLRRMEEIKKVITHLRTELETVMKKGFTRSAPGTQKKKLAG